MKGRNFNLKDYLEDKREEVNHYLLKIISLNDLNRELISAMKYSLMAGGKRLRPILCIAASECIKGINKDNGTDPAIIPACAIEMIHTYSLIHDDLPAMDDDDLRRGKPTLHKQYDEFTAILAGDALLTHAFYLLTNAELHHFQPFPSDIIVKLISIISEAAGTNGMVEGQMLDMLVENKPSKEASIDYLLKMHGLKTGKMIRASIESGAVSAGADNDELSSLILYAENIGTAFQITDDILDVEGDAETLGKPVGSDILNQKLTFPSVLGLDESKEYAKDLILKALKAVEIFGDKALPLKEIANYIIKRNY